MLNDKIVANIRTEYAKGALLKDVARKNKISTGLCSQIVNNDKGPYHDEEYMSMAQLRKLFFNQYFLAKHNQKSESSKAEFLEENE
jgi:hypothetical protein